MRRIENIALYIAVGIMLIASFKMPEILVEIENKQIEKQVYEKENNKNLIDVEVEKIYLVKAIHSTESGNYMIKFNSENMKIGKRIVVSVSNDTQNDLEAEVLKLKEYNILGNYENNSKQIEIGVINKVYQNEDEQYQVDSFGIKIGENEYQIEREAKTGKILCAAFKKDLLSTCITKEELMRNYTKYLDLYIIDDWKYEENMLKSEKANLVVNLVESDDMAILSIHTIERVMNKIEVVQYVKDTN